MRLSTQNHRLLGDLLARGAKLEAIDDPTAYICVRHGNNVTADLDGMQQPGWEQVSIAQYIPHDDSRFYTNLADITSPSK